ncbi:MAG: DEAD/DEAH box helicase, partial [Actinomycetota bacterium]
MEEREGPQDQRPRLRASGPIDVDDRRLSTDRFEALLNEASSEVETEGLLHLVRSPRREARTARLDPAVHGAIADRLRSRGIEDLWTHQAHAIARLRDGHNVIVSTGTASGKSLCFNVAVFERILADRKTKALYLYPTKALAQDQLRAIRAFAIPEIAAATYDGDTPQDERPSVRRFANIVLSNPDMLHLGILPQHQHWAEFFGHLEFIVVDEAHMLKGVFGSHVGCILRRTLRVARHYGAEPRFILTSATIGNPRFLAETLIGKDFIEITEDGSPRGERLFAFWNPPFIDEQNSQRGSTNWESARLVGAFVSNDVRTLAFAKSRKGAELIAKYAKQMVPVDKEEKIRPYRAGYLASERREIEQQIFKGQLLGVAATTALELGVDIGGLDAVVITGFPGTVAQVWQQAGRAGRSSD